jgi:hypothetical protein
MSYSVSLFHPDVRQRVAAGDDFDAFDHPPLPSEDVEQLCARLEKYGYRRAPVCPRHTLAAYVKQIGRSAVEVWVWKTQITFTAPYGDAPDAIFAMLQTAAELCDTQAFVLHNPQTREWGP